MLLQMVVAKGWLLATRRKLSALTHDDSTLRKQTTLVMQGQKTRTLTAEWLRVWHLLKSSINPHNRDRIPASMGRTFGANGIKAYKRRIYDTFHTLLRETTEPPDMCITRLWPNTDWAIVWKNLHTAPIPGTTKAIWYQVLHDILPTNERLHNIRLGMTDRCRRCDRKDSTTPPYRMWGWGNNVRIDTEEDSNSVENGPVVHTTRMDTAPTIQIVATTTPSCGFMGPGTVSAIQSVAVTCTYTT
jgi:hypothetical protein